LTHPKNRTHLSLHLLFAALIIAYMILGWTLIWHIPYSFPFGGPDEPMHLSMADYIAKHLTWPQWDSKEVVRNAYGVSYSAGGSIVYWLHGVTYRLFGHHRIAAFMLLLVYLLLSVLLYRRNVLAGFVLLAGLIPQTLFIFSYVNSDSGTVITALMFGMSVGVFVTAQMKEKYFWILLFFAGLAVTARQHLWAIAFLTLVWALVYRRKAIMQFDKRVWLIALLLGLLPASWWFATSYFANDGDILGVFTNAKSIMKFGNPDLPSLARPWSNFSVSNFLESTLVSLYASWGWMSIMLKPYAYKIVSIVALLIAVLLYRHIDRKIFGFFILLLLANFGFMILYSTSYDYQAQGRYLFPSVYVIIGMISTILVVKKSSSRPLLILLVILSLMNVYHSTKLTLTNYIDSFIEKPVVWQDSGAPQISTEAIYHIDQFQNIDGKILIRGWIYDRLTGHIFDTVRLGLKGDAILYEAKLERQARPDVAAAFGNSALKESGFAAKMIDIRGLKKGVYRYVLIVQKEGKAYLVPLKGVLKI